ncbi:hypothetical protein G6F50_016155 [Rhizopus delemar]|uniref:Uncharacterized protein n=1 Tax=Rhizopus delemar TaxID=936053 RepID=A0A9P6XUT2_9FUNG|nr:hypothetical protein G6F50_016155 [Rhizopus delemar]
MIRAAPAPAIRRSRCRIAGLTTSGAAGTPATSTATPGAWWPRRAPSTCRAATASEPVTARCSDGGAHGGGVSCRHHVTARFTIAPASGLPGPAPAPARQ